MKKSLCAYTWWDCAMWNNIGHTDHLSMSNQTFNVDLVQADSSPLIDSFGFVSNFCIIKKYYILNFIH